MPADGCRVYVDWRRAPIGRRLPDEFWDSDWTDGQPSSQYDATPRPASSDRRELFRLDGGEDFFTAPLQLGPLTWKVDWQSLFQFRRDFPMPTAVFDPLSTYQSYPLEDMRLRAASFYDDVRRRRTVREFSERPVPRDIIEHCVRAAGTAPSGANLQPWHFALVESASIKKQIRAAAEQEEHDFYHGKAPAEWLEALSRLGTDEHKPFLEIAPHLIVVFYKTHDELPDGRIVKHYYAQESVGIATGLLINALHHCGLVSLTHTPSPMKFLNQILGRPKFERPFLILVTGFPADHAVVPRITKKSLDEIRSIH